MMLTNAGRLLLGTTSEGTQILQVQGDAFIKGSGATVGTIGLTVQNSAGTNIFRIYNNGRFRLGNTNSSPLFYPQATSAIGEDLSATNLGFYSYTASQSAIDGRYWFSGEQMTQTSSANYNIVSLANFAPTSGTATFANIFITSQINQTGGANGITRGLYVNPTLTAAADWRSIEWSNNSGWGLYGAGTAPNFLGGNTTISFNQNAITSLNVSNTASATGSVSAIRATSSNGVFDLGKTSSLTSSNKIINSNDGYLYNGAIGDISILNDFSNGRIKFAAGGSSTAQATITAAGRLLLGTTSESTFILDVNGTSRISGASTFGGNINLRSTLPTTLHVNTAFLFLGTSGAITGNTNQNDIAINNNSYFDGTNNVYKNNGFATSFYSDTTGNISFYNAPSGTAGNVITYTERMRLTAAGRLLLGTTTESTFLLDVNGTARVSGAVTNTTGGFIHSSTTSTNDAFYTLLSSNIRFYVSAGGYCKSTSNIVSDTNGATSLNASAIAQIDSTTKGFLPPRMTTTQKNAIGTPAAGLQVYDTTLNQMSYYNGTTWVNF
jgi:hypothetical protein